MTRFDFSISLYLGPNFTQQMHCLSSFQSSGGGGDGVGRGGGGIHRWSSSRTTSNQSTETHRQKIRYVRWCSRSVKQGGRRDTKSLKGSTHTARRGKFSEPMIHCCSTKVVLSYQRETLAKIHECHQRIDCCLTRVQTSVWWPGISRELTEMVTGCSVCARDAALRKEPMMLTPLPDYPWQVVGPQYSSEEFQRFAEIYGINI